MIRLLGITCLCLAGCSTNPPIKENIISGKYKNSCLPEAIIMTQELEKSGIQSKVLTISTSSWKHAVCVYLYPSGDNQLWVYDSNWKSLRIRAWWDSPEGIARAWVKATGRDIYITSARFL